MPTKEQILESLLSIVNNYSIVATIWHIAFYLLLAFLFSRWVPSNKMLILMLSLPLLSVSIFAWSSGNPFNGSLFLILVVLVFLFGLKASSDLAILSSYPFLFIGIIMVVFGLVYPHFLETDSLLKYLYASPAGLIPCPTLSVVIGFALIFNGFGSQTVTVTLISFGLFYGIFGVLKLAVYLDLFLLFGTLSLLMKYIFSMRNIPG